MIPRYLIVYLRHGMMYANLYLSCLAKCHQTVVIDGGHYDK